MTQIKLTNTDCATFFELENKYELSKIIAIGSTGTVNEAINSLTQQKVAIKRV